MNGRAKKKLDKLYKRDFAAKAEEEAHKMATVFFQHIVRPKPRLIPLWLWSFFFRRFIHVPDDYKPNFSKERGLLDG